MFRIYVFFYFLLLDGIGDGSFHEVVLSVSIFSELVVQGGQLLKESQVWLNFPCASHVLEGLCGGIVFLEHKIGCNDCGTPRVAHETVDKDEPAAHGQGPVDELRAVVEKFRYLCVWHVLANEALVADARLGVLGGVDPHVDLGSVQHVGHPEVKQVVDVFYSVSVADDDAGKDFVAILFDPNPAVVVQLPVDSRHHPDSWRICPQGLLQFPPCDSVLQTVSLSKESHPV